MIRSRSPDDSRTVHIVWSVQLRRFKDVCEFHEFETEDEAREFASAHRDRDLWRIDVIYRYHPSPRGEPIG